MEALDFIAPLGGQEFALGVVGHPLGDDPQIEAAREADDGPHDGRVVAAVGQGGDEGAVDFQRIDRESAQVDQRRIAGPEIIDRDAHPELAEPHENACDRLGIAHQARFGDLDFQPVGGEPRGGKRRFEYFGEVRLLELHRRDVDRDAHRRAGVLRPAGGVAAGLLQRPAAKRRHQLAFLGDLNEGIGHQHTVPGMLPAHQRLGADDPARGKLELGLVVQPQLVRRQGTAKIAGQADAVLGLGGQLGGVEGEGGAGLAGGVERCLGAAGQLLGRARIIGIQGDPDMGRHADFIEQLLGQKGGRIEAVEIGLDDREGGFGNPRDGIGAPHRGGQPFARCRESAVIDIGRGRRQEDGQRPLAAVGPSDRLAQAIVEKLARRQAGKGIVERHGCGPR